MVWLIKAAEACARQVSLHGLDLVRRVWEAGGSNGPVAGLRAVLHFCGVEASIDVWTAGGCSLRGPLEGGAAARKVSFSRFIQTAFNVNIQSGTELKRKRKNLQRVPKSMRHRRRLRNF